MKRFLPLATFLIILISCGLAGAEVWITYRGPFHPGNPFFQMQVFGEQVFERFISDETGRAEFALSVLLRRTIDLRFVSGTENEALALEYLNQAIDQASSAVAAAPQEAAGNLRSELLQLIQSIETALQGLNVVSRASPDLLASLAAKVGVLKNMLGEADFSQANLLLVTGIPLQRDVTATPLPSPAGLPTRTPLVMIQPHVVLFPPGSPGALHEFYPLIGQHAKLDCLICHSEGRFAGASNTCESCHLEVRPASHFPGECSLCHSPASWNEIHFDHSRAGATDCIACHSNRKPANHYPGQCSACHSTSAWKPATFNHQAPGATDCSACHNNRKPANHYPGQCSACHSTSAWKPATFNHQAAGATDCVACHASRAPANHYSGQCSACHSTSAWTPANFNHEAAGATDCVACHASRAPANHYNGQCSACHSTSTWSGATFNHEAAGATDCIACHSSRKPANHFAGQCLACHSTSGWRPANFNHQAAGATDCIACHSANKPANHFDGQCSQCHTTSTWAGATFNHSFPINHGRANGNCSACHPSGGSAWTCYNCHNQSEMEKHHAEKDILDIASRCVSCHPSGNKD